MTDTFDDIKKRVKAATPGPWEWGDGDVDTYVELKPDIISALGQGRDCMWIQNSHDAAFIAAARTDIPLLLAEIERLQKELKKHCSQDIDCDPCWDSALTKGFIEGLTEQRNQYKRALELACGEIHGMSGSTMTQEESKEWGGDKPDYWLKQAREGLQK